jgi:hypothetical protein
MPSLDTSHLVEGITVGGGGVKELVNLSACWPSDLWFSTANIQYEDVPERIEIVLSRVLEGGTRDDRNCLMTSRDIRMHQEQKAQRTSQLHHSCTNQYLQPCGL